MFSAESRITMTMLTAIVVFTCTWLFANADPKPCPQAFDCINSRTICPSNTTFTCLRNLRGTCDVDESKVTFSSMLPYSQKLCNDSIPEISPCANNFVDCVKDSKLSQILRATPDEQQAMSGFLVSSYTYCSTFRYFAACAINEKQAGRCTFSTVFSNYLINAKQSLNDLCGSTGGLVVNSALTLIGAAIASFAK
ncbi:uncharacterized protein LOC112559908 isoform X5 [Pomacea canaliculata]|uniref:uncharacterized protein LOC112559908 isoform X5 n=1 Tax=Pomacea canaliculata TaxID=400727 RepID=UPI000D72E0F0|nr:uncharacterized protein LOC112559908 isoform X5 [Pomacea canaliculata]